jgi:DNA-binding transcriptional LysR family regulator
MLKLRALEIFRAAMREGSLTEAGRSLQMSQPAVSKTVRHMEDTLGFPLFERVRGRLQPTKEATALFEEVDKLFDGVELLERYAIDLRDAQSGILKVGATPSLSSSLLSIAVADFRLRRPRVRVWLHIGTTRQIINLVTDHQLDLGVIFAPADDRNLAVSNLFATEIVCVMHRDNPLSARRTIGPEDLKDQPIITNVRNEPIHAALRRAFGKADIDRQTSVGTNNTITACSLAEAGAGIALVDPFFVRERFPKLIIRPFRPKVPLQPRVIYSGARPLSRLSRSFMDVLASCDSSDLASHDL